MRPRHGAQTRGLVQSAEEHKLRNVDLVCPLCFLVGDVAEPFKFGRNVGEVAELSRR